MIASGDQPVEATETGASRKDSLPFWRWLTTTPAGLGMLILVLSFHFFARHTAPSVTWNDSGLFAMAAAWGGVAHPPGAPTYSLLTSALQRLFQFDDPARLTNLFSAFCGALTLGLATWLGLRWRFRLAPDRPMRVVEWFTVTVVLLLMTGRESAFFENATTTEQYTLLTALLFGVLLLADHLMHSEKFEVLGGFVLGALVGLAIGNHPSQIVLLGVLGLVVAWRLMGRSEAKGRVLAGALATSTGLLIGLLVFLWLPFRAAADPPLNWGNVDNLERFHWAITRAQWEGRPIREAPIGFTWEWVRSFVVGGPFLPTIFLAGLAFFGFVRLASQRRIEAILPLVGILPYLLGLLVGHLRQAGMDIAYIKGYGIGDWHLPLYIGAFVFAVYTLADDGWRPPQLTNTPNRLWLMVLALVMAGTFFVPFPTYHRSALLIRERIRDSLPLGSVVIASSDSLAFGLAYDRYVLGIRPDMDVVISNTSFLAILNDSIVGGNHQRAAEWIDRVAADRLLVPVRPEGLMSGFQPGRPVYTEFTPRHPDSVRHLAPGRILFEVADQPLNQEEAARILELRPWARFVEGLAIAPEDRQAREFLGQLAAQRASYLRAHGLLRESATMFEVAAELRPWDGATWFVLGDLYESLEDVDAAKAVYTKSIEANRWQPDVRTNLALLVLKGGNPEEALRLLREEAKLFGDPQARGLIATIEGQLAK